MVPRMILLALAPLAAQVAQDARPPATWLDPDRGGPPGTSYHTFASKLAAGEVSYLIYLPPDYDTAAGRRYPVVYWLHGLGGNQRAGGKFVAELNAAIEAGKAPPMIAVLVNGLRDKFYCDSPDGKWPLESAIVKELIPHVDRTYRTMARRESRAVEGFSMGGYGAAHLGFKYPELFGIVGIMSGALLDTERMSAQNTPIFQNSFHGDKEFMRANDPFTIVRKNADAIRGRTAVRIAVGGEDALQVRDRAFHELLNELKVEHEFEVVPGVAHNSVKFYEALGDRAFGYYVRVLRVGGLGAEAR